MENTLTKREARKAAQFLRTLADRLETHSAIHLEIYSAVIREDDGTKTPLHTAEDISIRLRLPKYD